jgi:hypothetical protein
MVALRCYDPSGTGGGIHRWYGELPDDVRATIDGVLENLDYERQWSTLPQFKELRGKCRGLHEIIIGIEDGRQFRILGFGGPGGNEFTLLLGFQKTQRRSIDYGPACASALQRKQGVIRDVRRAPRFRFPHAERPAG